MEADAILEGFIKAEPRYGLRYLELVGDGDASLMSTLIEKGPYWCRDIKKVECANHVCKNIRVALEELVVKHPEYKGKGKLTQKQRIRIVNCVRGAIRMRNREMKSTGQRQPAVQRLRIDIDNCVQHVFGKHTRCSEEYCKVKKEINDKKNADSVDTVENGQEINDVNNEEEIISSVLNDQASYWNDMSIQEEEECRNIVPPLIIFEDLPTPLISDVKQILNRVIQKAHMLIDNSTTNLAECWMSIRSKFDGGKQINRCMRGSWNARCSGASLRFQNGPMWSPKVWSTIFNQDVSQVFSGEYNRRVRKKETNKKYSDSWKGKARRVLWKELRSKASTEGKHAYGTEATQVIEDLPEDIVVAKCKEFYNDKIKITPQQAQQIEQCTRQQSLCNDWNEQRKNRVTSSTFHNILVRNTVKFGFSKLVDNIVYKKSFQTNDTEYGLAEEIHTSNEYLAELRKQNPSFSYSTKCSGLVIDSVNPFLGASPDCLVLENDVEGLAEFKNLSKYRNLRIIEALDKSKLDKTLFPLKTTTDGVHLKTTHAHYTQCQGQLMVTKKPWVDYVLRTKVDIYVERIYPNSVFQTKLQDKLKKFYFNSYLPEIVLPRRNKGGIREYVPVFID